MATKTWALFRVTAGDKNAERRKELKEKIAQEIGGTGITKELAQELVMVMNTNPVHDFYVAVPDDGFGTAAIAVEWAWEKLGAKTSDDLPKPFNLVRVTEEVIVVGK